MESMDWKGNMTIKMDDSEGTYSPGSIQIEEYAKGAFSLLFSSSEGRGIVTVRMEREEYKDLILTLVRHL